MTLTPTNQEAPVPDPHADYRATVRKTLAAMSDQALRFQDTRVRGGIDRVELDAEMNRRGI